MASDLISRDALRDVVKSWYWNGDLHNAKDDPAVIDAMTDLTIRTINKAPAVDAVEVVRCKDCVHAGAFPNNYAARRFEGGMNCYLCRGDDGYGIANVSVVYHDDYCSDGVRRVKEDAVD